MRVLSTLRGLPVESSSSSAQSPSVSKNRLSIVLPSLVLLLVIADLAFLGRLNFSKNVVVVDTLVESLLSELTPEDDSAKETAFFLPNSTEKKDRYLESETCEEFLEREDAVRYSRDFDKDPILVTGAVQEWKTCDVGCCFGFFPDKNIDAAFDLHARGKTAGVLRSMESASYYADNNIAMARRMGYDIIMTTSLSSDVPVGYFSWAEYDIMAPVQPKTEKALAAAFISNCGARNFRLQAVTALEKWNVSIDSYGGCHHNHDGGADKVETLRRYKFSLAFENSNEEDYVTEKFFQSLVAGTIPVVIGAPNIQDFAPAPGSILHIKNLEDVESVANTMKYLAENWDAYNWSIRWKYEGPSDSFKAMLDMAAVHSSCRLCIHLATLQREKEEDSSMKRPCNCTRGSEMVHHIYVRERGRFKLESIFMRSKNMTIRALEHQVLHKFKSLRHIPIWKSERPQNLRGAMEDYRIYRIYPLGLTQRQALHAFHFHGDDGLKKHLETTPCSKFEVIFV